MTQVRRRLTLPGVFLLTLFIATVVLLASRAPAGEAGSDAVAAPTLKWQNGGCYSSWCETGWYSSPAVVDLDGDGASEVVAAAYSMWALNGEDGSIQWSVDTPGGRVWPGVIVTDLDDDGDVEVAIGQGGGHLTVYDHQGNVVWSLRPVDRELRGLSAFDLEGDNTLELIATAAVGSRTNTWVFEHTGALRPGWPQLNNDSGYAWGVFNDNAATGDMDEDGAAEIVVPSDVHYINAYEGNGVQIPAHPMYGDKGWGKVGVHVSHEVDLRGYAHCGEEHRPNFAHTPATMGDVNGDGEMEVVALGNVYNCGTNPYTSLYEMPFIFNADRSRWRDDGYDWVAIPVPDGDAGPLSEDYHVIESAMSNPVLADLDDDGEQEILYASYDGRVHAYWLDKQEHHNWPYSVHATGPGIRFASEPVVADLDGDGPAEVIFASWPEKGTGYSGKLHVLDYQGNVLHEVDLPAPYGGADWNGVLAAPTLGNVDGDADLEVVLNAAHAGVVVYDLPGTAGARVLWGTGRGNYQRSGSPVYGSLATSSVQMTPARPGAGAPVTVTITLRNSGPDLPDVGLQNALPGELLYDGELTASSGTAAYGGGEVTWTGAVSAVQPVSIRYRASVDDAVTEPTFIANEVEVDNGAGTLLNLRSAVVANGNGTYLPLSAKE